MDWLPRSSNITSLDILFWGYAKDQIFRPKVGSVVEFLERMNSAVSSVTCEMLVNTRREIEYRLDILRATNGAHTERY
jgi:hypothetical protein